MKKNIGVTLLELLVVLVIVALLCGLGFPVYRQLAASTRGRAAILQLYRAVQLAKSEAIKHNVAATICASSDQHSCVGNWQDGYLVFVDQQGDGQVDPEDKVIRFFPGSFGQCSITWKSFPARAYLQMSPQGFPNGQDGTFAYVAKNNLYKASLIVSKTGRLRIT